MTNYIHWFRNAHPRTKSFVLNIIYMTILILGSTFWAYWNLVEDRTEIPRKEHQEQK